MLDCNVDPERVWPKSVSRTGEASGRHEPIPGRSVSAVDVPHRYSVFGGAGVTTIGAYARTIRWLTET